MSIQKPTDVQVEHPAHLFRQQSGIERVQRMMLAASRPEPIRKAEEIGFVDGVQDLDRAALDDFVFQRSHTERTLLPVGLGDVHPPHRLGPVRSTLEPLGEALEVVLQPLAVASRLSARYAVRRVCRS